MSKKVALLRPLQRSRRNDKEIESWISKRDEWVTGIAPDFHFQKMIDYIPGVHFFAKDRDGRVMFASRGLLARYSMRDEMEILGRSDFDLNPDLMAQSYVEDDRILVEDRLDFLERIELWWDRQGMPDWFIVTKLPIRDRSGNHHGIMGILRRPSESDKELPIFQTVAKAVEIIRRDYAKPVSIAEIAGSCGQSVRQLQRKFQDAFGISPQTFLIKTRLLAAQHLLEETILTVAEIADQCGFVDSSSFVQHFRKRIGVTPMDFRRKTTKRTKFRAVR